MAAKWTAQQIPQLTGKTALITGANSGIGYQAALELARHGAHVLLAVRNPAKGQEALIRLLREAPGSSAEVVELDVASLQSILSFSKTFAATARPLDILINNAGVMALPTRELTADGFERQFGTNHLGHFALTGLLIPQLLAAPEPRVVTVSSLAHRNGKIDFNNLQSENSYVPWDAYNASKLANLLFALELARKAVGGKLSSLACHPGVSTTSIFQYSKGFDPKRIAVKLLAPLLFQNDENGALPTLYAATDPAAKSGEYIGPSGPGNLKGSPAIEQPKPQALDTAVAERLWHLSEQLTGVTYPPLV